MPALILTFLTFIYYFAGSGLLSRSLHQNAWDLGVFNQVLYNSATGHLFAYSFRSFGNYLGDHFSPVLALFAPLSLFKTSLPLLFAQSLGLALAVFVLYQLSLLLLKNRVLSLAVAFSFAVNPFTLNIVNFDFHPDFAFPLLFFLVLYFLFKSNPSRTSAFLTIILLQTVREDAFLLIAPLAVIGFWKLRDGKFAILTILFTTLYTSLVLFQLMPGIRGQASSPLSEHYSYFGGSVVEIAQNILKNPGMVVFKIFGERERLTIVKFLGSVGFFGLLSPQITILSLPIFASHLLSVIPMRINLEGHYSAQLLAIMYAAVVFGVKGTDLFLRTVPKTRTVLISAYLVGVSLLSFFLFSPLPPSLSAKIDRFTITRHTRLFFELKKMIPDSASVSAQTNLVPELAFRKEIYEFPDLRQAEYVWLDSFGAIARHAIDQGFSQQKEKLPSLGYKLIFDRDGYLIYQKLIY